MDVTNIAMAVFFFALAYIMFSKYIFGEDDETKSVVVPLLPKKNPEKSDQVTPDSVKEVVYTQDYYPWWRSTRWWNYDGWLYQKPYYNYWRRP